MRNRISSALQLGPAGLARRLFWRAKMVAKIARFRFLVPKGGGLTKYDGSRKLSSPTACFLAGKEDVIACLGNQDALKDRELARIRDIVTRLEKGRVDSRGTGEVSLSLNAGNWYGYEGDAVLMVNRHDFLLSLVQYQLISESEKNADTIARLFTYWVDNFSTVNLVKYDKPIDAAIRLLNWLWVFHYDYLVLDERRREKLLDQIHIQLEYIITWCSAGGNHLVLEALSVFVYGCVFGDSPYGRRWKKWGRGKLMQEIVREVMPDGVHSEQSTFYHQVVSTHFLKFYLTEVRQGSRPPTLLVERLDGMIEYSHQSMKPDLSHPILGDGNLLSTDDREHWESKVLIAARASVFNKPIYSGFVSTLNDSSIWFLGLNRSSLQTTGTCPESRVYENSGIAVFRHGGNYLLFDAAPFGDPEFPHHGHADALSIELAWNGENICVDSGGYGYIDDSYRRYFRSTRAHNTIQVDKRDQSQIYGVFGYGRLARVEPGRSFLSAKLDFAEAEHDGYHPVIHKRQVFLRKSSTPYLLIVDFISGAGIHTIEQFFHFADGVRFDYPVAVTPGGRRIELVVFGNKDLELSHECAQDQDPVQGWISRHTAEKRPGNVLIASALGELPFYLATLISASDDSVHGDLDAQNAMLRIHTSETTEVVSIDVVERSAKFDIS